jgi:hypothetical protein
MTKYEKQVKDILEKNSPLKLDEDFFWESLNAYGDRHKNAWGIWNSSIKKYKIKNIDTYLLSKGIQSSNIWVGSDVHGWTHRLLYKKGDNYNKITYE